ncbi:hypothetical protein, partial [Klebsiella pneumoniae]|uniref:hypothetical protein n=1 Tax=Klebsiella pneumoniae TaxID=573 RepID=UPI003013D8B7
ELLPSATGFEEEEEEQLLCLSSGSFYISSLKELEPSLKGNAQQIQKEIQMYNIMEKHSCLGL